MASWAKLRALAVVVPVPQCFSFLLPPRTLVVRTTPRVKADIFLYVVPILFLRCYCPTHLLRCIESSAAPRLQMLFHTKCARLDCIPLLSSPVISSIGRTPLSSTILNFSLPHSLTRRAVHIHICAVPKELHCTILSVFPSLVV